MPGVESSCVSSYQFGLNEMSSDAPQLGLHNLRTDHAMHEDDDLIVSPKEFTGTSNAQNRAYGSTQAQPNTFRFKSKEILDYDRLDGRREGDKYQSFVTEKTPQYGGTSNSKHFQ
jgi:hypothetical protein